MTLAPLAAAAFALSLACLAAAPAPRQSAESVPVVNTLRYLRYLPPGYDADPKDAKGSGRGWPLVIFLHGIGERGTDVQKVKLLGPPRMVADGHDFPFVLLSPQCPDGVWWSPEAVVGLVDHAVKTMHVDADRVYLTGLSWGGFGTWSVLGAFPDRFAAAVPICGGGETVDAGPMAGTMPVWSFHGRDDNVVPLARNQKMVDAYRRAGNPEAKLTVYDGVGHDAWTRTYNDPEVWKWLLSHTRKNARPATRPGA